MGKWAQQKKRGSSSGSGLLAPPAPLLTDTAGDLIQDSTGTGNTGGQVELSEANTEFGPWFVLSTDVWDPSYDWGAVGDFDGPYLSGVEIGNGTNYAGRSERSNAFAV